MVANARYTMTDAHPRTAPSRVRESGESYISNTVPSHWTIVHVGDVAELINGYPFKSSTWRESGMPIIRIQNLNDSSAAFNYFTGELPDKFRVKSGDLLFAWSGTPGTSFGTHAWNGPDAWLNQHIFKVLFDRRCLHPRYLQLALNQNLKQYIEQSQGGGGLGHITKGQVLGSLIPLPPVEEQARIVTAIHERFASLDTGVRALRRIDEQLGRYRTALFAAACAGKLVKTEAELAQHAKRSGRKTYESAERLVQRIIAERRKLREELDSRRRAEPEPPDVTGLPRLPNGWTWATIDQLAAPEPNSITDGPYGSNLKSEHYRKQGPRVIRLQNIGDGVFLDQAAHISRAHFSRLKKHQIFGNDIAIAAFGEHLPRACIIPDNVGPAVVKADCIRFRPHDSVLREYLNAALNSEPVRNRTKRMIHGLGRPRLNLREIKSVVVPVPPRAEQRRIVAELNRRLKIAAKMRAFVDGNLQRAATLREAILDKAFQGKLAAKRSNDTPVDVLLDISQQFLSTLKQRYKDESKIMMKKVKASRKTAPPSLLTIIASHPRGIRPEELFREARYAPPEVDRFYQDLARISEQIIEVRSAAKLQTWPSGGGILLKLAKE